MNNGWLWTLTIYALLLTAWISPVQAQTPDEITYDLVIANGRAMDPETGLDAIRNIGISDGTIAAITDRPLVGKKRIDAHDHVVTAGFIDIHSHSPTPLGLIYQALDGVTTTLELEAGAYPIESYGSHIRDKALINYGTSAGSLYARIAAMTDFRVDYILETPKRVTDDGRALSRGFVAPASAAELAEIRAGLEEALQNGAIGIGVPLDYMNIAVKQAELRMLFDLGAEYSVPLFIHVRRGFAGDSRGLDEVLALAGETGTRILVCHLSHSAMQNTGMFLEKIRAARAKGSDIWTEVLPYNAGSVSIGAAVFNRDWRKIFNINYSDIQLAATGEWLTKESFDRIRKEDPSAAIIHHYLKEDWTRYLVTAPDVIISSDGLPAITTDKKIPPQGVGSFSKILGKYVRDEEALGLMTALSKMSLQPAVLLEKAAPLFRLKGRLQIGMDADITIFDPASIRANTTYENPHQASSGVQYLLVGGTIVVAAGEIKPDIYPGRFLKASPRRTGK